MDDHSDADPIGNGTLSGQPSGDVDTFHDQIQKVFTSRAVIDQAVGVLIGSRKCTSCEAVELMSDIARATGRELAVVAAEVIREFTGHEPEPPRPLTFRPGSGQQRDTGERPPP